MLAKQKKYSITFVGAQKSGKSALLDRFQHNTFHDEYYRTLESDFFEKFVKVSNKDEHVAIRFWSLGGNERIRPLLDSFLPDTSLLAIVYDVTSRQSFSEMSYWYNEAVRLCPDAALCLVGTHTDLRDKDSIKESQAVQQATAWGATPFVCSALTGDGVDEMFKAMVSMVARG